MSSTGAERFVEANGARLWTARHGSGPPLVLLHGGPGLWDYFDELATLLDDLVEVHRYDQRGGGRSQRVGPYDIETFVADLEALRAHWGHERWTVAGHSWGAALALAYAVAHPGRTEAVLHIDGTGVIDDWHEECEANADARRTPEQRARRAELWAIVKSGGTLAPELDREYCVLTWMADYAGRARAQQLASQLLRPYRPSYDVNAALTSDWARLTGDASFVAAAARIDAPVLVVHGADDPRPARLAERLASSLPRAELAIIPEAGHLPWVEQPERTRDVLRGFLVRAQAREGTAIMGRGREDAN
ncbi:MAG: alpha/beta hydrolase [Chloroflexi bacterium]|nr:alpha/beta hydrolase [Chloroflexota bacterium]